MGEPCPTQAGGPKKSAKELLTLLHHEHPQAVLERSGDQWAVYTLHGVGASEEEALSNAISSCRRMKEDGRALRQILDDVRTDLSSKPGMSKERHQSLTELLKTASNCLNDGVLTNTVEWILVPNLTRQIEELQRRVDMRLAMTAKEMKDAEDARRKAGIPLQKTGAEYIPGVGITKPRPKTGTLLDMFD